MNGNLNITNSRTANDFGNFEKKKSSQHETCPIGLLNFCDQKWEKIK